MRRVVHFEIPADDVERAKSFYGSVFEWDLNTMQMDEGEYTIATTTPVDESMMPTEPGGINGGLMRRSDETPSPVITIDVDDIEQSLKNVEAAGGTTVTPRTPIPGMGAFGYFKDPEGNVMGLWETSA
ncbi:MAG TPA: VOC family protein [Actinomycetota bacterium]